ncbi:MAG: glycosyltransferase family 4 protein [Saprospiraceae bacterium]|nr:glycosyltransferase family 4 protein [Saprospiraceae bacterium]
MKVLEFIRVFNERTATFIYNEMKGLIESDNDLRVACLRRINAERYPMEQVEIMQTSPLRRMMSYGFNRLGWRLNFANPAFRRHWNATISEWQPEVVHCHYGFDALFVIDNHRPSNLPVFISFHGYDASSLLQKPVYRRRLRQVFELPYVFPVFASRFMMENMKREGVPVPERSQVLYYGIDTDFFRRSETPPDTPARHFLQVSTFRQKKGHAYTLRAFARMLANHPEMKARLILAGDGPLLSDIKEMSEELGLGSKVEFPGFVSSEKARDLMQAAHVFVHHSVRSEIDGDMEGIPNSLMEAMAMELPVLSTYHAGIPELIEDGRHGFLVEERDVEALADRMMTISEWGLQAGNRERILRAFDRKVHAETLISYYRQAREIMKSQ